MRNSSMILQAIERKTCSITPTGLYRYCAELRWRRTCVFGLWSTWVASIQLENKGQEGVIDSPWRKALTAQARAQRVTLQISLVADDLKADFR